MDFDTELRRLAERVNPPVVPPGDDLARGRRRVRHGRFAASGAALATACAIGGVALLVAPGTDPGTERPGDPGPATSATPAYTDKALPLVEVPADGGFVPENAETLKAWRDVLAEHLDPGGTHLEKEPSNEQSGGGNVEGGRSLGTKLGWTMPGEDGLGLVQLAVASDRAELYDECGQTPGWECRDVTTPDGLAATVIDHDGVHEVVVEQADGEWVSISVNALFGNNSLVPVSGVELTDRELFAAAGDPRISLPPQGEVEQTVYAGPPGAAAMQALADSLLGDGERLARVHVEYGELRADVVRDGVRQGDLVVRAWPTIGAQEPVCQSDVYTACVERSTGDDTVFLGTLDPRANGGHEGWRVEHEGPTRVVSVRFSAQGGATLDRDRAAAAVVSDRWQD